jgi:hypothetical protein
VLTDKARDKGLPLRCPLIFAMFLQNFEIAKTIVDSQRDNYRTLIDKNIYSTFANYVDGQVREKMLNEELSDEVWDQRPRGILGNLIFFSRFKVLKSASNIIFLKMKISPLRTFFKALGMYGISFPFTPKSRINTFLDINMRLLFKRFAFTLVLNQNLLDIWFLCAFLVYRNYVFLGFGLSFIISRFGRLPLDDLKLNIILEELKKFSKKMNSPVFKYRFPRFVQADQRQTDLCCFCRLPLIFDEISEADYENDLSSVVQWGCGWHQFHKNCAQTWLNLRKFNCVICQHGSEINAVGLERLENDF